MRSLALFLARLGFAGFAPVAPATAGSALVALIGWFLPVPPIWVTAVLLVVGTALAVWVCGEAEKTLGHDAKPICADEAVGQTLALLYVPHHWAAFVFAFLLFRGFDVVKWFGAHQAQNLPGGYGVVADDVIAGITSCVAFHLVTIGLIRFAGIDPWAAIPTHF